MQDLSHHRTKAAAFRKALQYIRRGTGRNGMDVYNVTSAPDRPLGYSIHETWDVRIVRGYVVAQKYQVESGRNIGHPHVLGPL
jgi:hypothetical protein